MQSHQSLQRFLFTTQTAPSPVPRSSLSALLLSQASWHTLSSISSPEPPASPSPHDCCPLFFSEADFTTLEFVHFPSTATVASLENIGTPHYVDYRPSDACVAVSLSWQGDPAILFSPLLATPSRLWAAGGLNGRRVRAVSLAPTGPALAACVGPDVVLYATAPGDAFMRETMRLQHPDKSHVARARYAGEHMVVSGTSTGQVHCWDVRGGGRCPVWSVDPSGKRLYISNVRVGEVSGDVYVSCDLAEENRLAAWDMRVGVRQGPRSVFRREGWGDSVVFDVVEEAGLVAAGGSRCSVRMWDCWKGGDAMQSVYLDDEIKVVRLMGLSGKGEAERPGLFVKGEFETYVFEVGASDDTYANDETYANDGFRDELGGRTHWEVVI